MSFALILEWLIKSIVLVLLLLGGFAYLTLYERKALARLQWGDSSALKIKPGFRRD